MPNVQPRIESYTKIKVIGIGGSGLNAVNHMIASKFFDVEYISINTDTQDLHHSKADRKIHIGKNLTKGVGAGMNPEVGRKAAEETKAEIQEALKGADMIFIACGMGGGTGTGASPVIARLAREAGVLTVGVVTRPFAFEGEQRNKVARTGIDDLSKEVDALIVISNDRLLSIAEKGTSLRQAFALCDEVLLQSVRSIAEIIREKQTMNIDFADVRIVLTNAGSAFIGIGVASGENRGEEAAQEAINSPLLDISIDGATGVLLSIGAHPNDLRIHEINEVAKIINDAIDPNAKFIFGPYEDEHIKKGDLKVTIIATGFEQHNTTASRPYGLGGSASTPLSTSRVTPVQTGIVAPAIEPLPEPIVATPPPAQSHASTPGTITAQPVSTSINTGFAEPVAPISAGPSSIISTSMPRYQGGMPSGADSLLPDDEEEVEEYEEEEIVDEDEGQGATSNLDDEEDSYIPAFLRRGKK